MRTDADAWASAGLLYQVEEGVAWLRLNRPERRNALDHYPGGYGPDGMGLRDALLFAIRDASEDPAVKAAVITGNGPAFSAGADLRQRGGALEIPPERRRAPTVAPWHPHRRATCRPGSGISKVRSTRHGSRPCGRPSGRRCRYSTCRPVTRPLPRGSVSHDPELDPRRVRRDQPRPESSRAGLAGNTTRVELRSMHAGQAGW